MKVKNMQSTRGNTVPNQHIIIDQDDTKWFQSYNWMICKITADGNITFDPKYWKYSRTTSKYLNMFLHELGGVSKSAKELVNNNAVSFNNLNGGA